MSSRFFTAGDSSSDSDSSDEEQLYSDDEEMKQEPEDSDDDDSDEDDDDDDDDSDSSSDDDGRRGVNKFLRDVSSESEDSDDDQPKVVKSAKDKRLEEMDAVIKAIDNAKKIGDWSVISTEFDKLNRQITKLTAGQKAPKQYIKQIADLEDLMNETLAKQKVTPKKMNATNARGLNAMKQKIKKNNKDYDDEIAKFREDKDAFMESDEEEEIEAPKPKKSDTYVTIPTNAADADDGGFSTIGKGGKALQYTPESILSHLRAINESRGRKNTDRSEQIRIMERLLGVAQTPYQKIRVLMTLISTRFDLISHSASGYMSQESWKQADAELIQLLEVLEANRDIIVVESAEAWEDDEKQPTITPGETFKIPGSMVSIFERLDDELTRSLQHIDPHTAEYIDRLQDEQALYDKLLRGQVYVESVAKDHSADLPQENLNRMIMRRIEHVYFKPQQVITILEKNAWTSLPDPVDSFITPRSKELSPSELMTVLCTYLFEKSEHIIRARAFLCQVYYTALHDQYHRARDMLLMSHLQENIPNFDVSTQILFNRTLVQVGLCAFRGGLVYDAQTTLQDICGSGRQKELLAQGVVIQRYVSVSPEQERLERQRQLPFHMHINLELLECVYLTCSMLLEIPLMAQMGSSPDIRKRVFSKTFRRHFDFHERQIFTGPPENTRDHIMQASKALAMGEWKRSVELINSIKIWELMADAEKIKSMLSGQIQEEGLRTYLFTYASYYDTLSVDTLSQMFELSERKVTAVVSKMISHDEIAAALDQSNSNIIFRKGVELSRLQSLALTLSDKASGLIESNERTLEQRTSGMENRFERQGGQRTRGGGRGRGGAQRTGGQRTRGGQQFGGGALGSAIKA